MSDGRIRMTVSVVYDVNLGMYNECKTVGEVALIDADYGMDSVYAVLENNQNVEITFEELVNE